MGHSSSISLKFYELLYLLPLETKLGNSLFIPHITFLEFYSVQSTVPGAFRKTRNEEPGVGDLRVQLCPRDIQ
jgi:hypothetical protein